MEWYILLGIIKQWLIKNFLVNILKKLILKKIQGDYLYYCDKDINTLKLKNLTFFNLNMSFEFDYNDLFEFPDDI